MEPTGAIFVLPGLTFATRVLGFGFGRRILPPAIDRFLADVPVAVFAVLVMLGLGVGASAAEAVPRLVAMAAAVAVKGGPLWGTLTVGLAAFWLLRLA